MSTLMVKLVEDTGVFMVDKRKRLKYTCEELFQNRSRWRFKCIEHIKIFLTRINRKENNMKFSMKNNKVVCVCNCVKNCPFRIVIIQSKYKSGYKVVKSNYRISEFIKHDHSIERQKQLGNLDLQKIIDRQRLKMTSLESELQQLENSIDSSHKSRKENDRKLRNLKQRLNRAKDKLSKMEESHQECALDTIGYCQKNINRYLKARALLEAKVFIVKTWWSYLHQQSNGNKAVQSLSSISGPNVTKTIVNC